MPLQVSGSVGAVIEQVNIMAVPVDRYVEPPEPLNEEERFVDKAVLQVKDQSTAQIKQINAARRSHDPVLT